MTEENEGHSEQNADATKSLYKKVGIASLIMMRLRFF